MSGSIIDKEQRRYQTRALQNSSDQRRARRFVMSGSMIVKEQRRYQARALENSSDQRPKPLGHNWKGARRAP